VGVRHEQRLLRIPAGVQLGTHPSVRSPGLRPPGVRALMAKGFAGTVFLTTDDVHASYEELKRRGFEFVEEPEERPYGIDSSFRDPSGNNIRLTEVRELAAV
jgi:Glyoxalase/Bleomycin resistance protein/Dioxygenase superfamily